MAPGSTRPPVHTFIFKTVRGVDYHGDCYLPRRRGSSESIPILLYWHGGGLTSGTREWDGLAPTWLFEPALEDGIAVISLEYTLLGPQSAHCIIDDIRETFDFIRTNLKSALPTDGPRLDPDRIAVSGSSAGGYVCYAAAAALPGAIKAVISIYGAGGDMLSDWYLQEKKEPFLPGIPPLTDLTPYRTILKQPIATTPPTVCFPLGDFEPRNLLLFYLLQTGTLLDALSGKEGVSSALRTVPCRDRPALVQQQAPELATVLPSLWITERYPPTMILHGTADSLVKLEESRALAEQMRTLGVDVTLHEIEGGVHGFDTPEGWRGGPGGHDAELTRRKDEILQSVLPWLLARI